MFRFLCSVVQQCGSISDATSIFIQDEVHGAIYLSSQPGRSFVWMHCLDIVTIILGVMSIQCINLVCRVLLCSRMSITEGHVGLL